MPLAINREGRKSIEWLTAKMKSAAAILGTDGCKAIGLHSCCGRGSAEARAPACFATFESNTVPSRVSFDIPGDRA